MVAFVILDFSRVPICDNADEEMDCNFENSFYVGDVGNVSVGDDEAMDVELLDGNSFDSIEEDHLKLEILKSTVTQSYTEIIQALDHKKCSIKRRIDSSIHLINTLNEKARKIANYSREQSNDINNCEDCCDLVHLLAAEVKVSEKVSQRRHLVSLAPPSWTIDKISSTLEVNKSIVRSAKAMRRERKSFLYQPNKPKRFFSRKTKDLVASFYNHPDVSSTSPCQNQVVSIKQKNGKKKKVMKQLLLRSIKQTFLDFQEKYPQMKMSFTSFYRLKPRNVVLPNARSLSSCVCIYHANLCLKAEVFGRKYSHKDFLAEYVCDISSKSCMFGTCSYCPGAESLSGFLQAKLQDKIIDNTPVKYRAWEKCPKGFVELNRKEASVESFINGVCEDMPKFTRHHFIAKAQNRAFEQAKENLSEGEMIILSDFSENFEFKVNRAPQSRHYKKKACTIVPFILFHRLPTGETKQTNTVVFSDSLDHNTAMWHACRIKVLNFIKEKFDFISDVRYFSDGASSQFKNRKNMGLLLLHEEILGLSSSRWCFYCTSHGKNQADAIAGIIKRNVEDHSIRAVYQKQIQKPKEMFKHVCENFPHIKSFFISKAECQVVASELESLFENFLQIKGMRSRHSFVPISGTKKMVMYDYTDDLPSGKEVIIRK